MSVRDGDKSRFNRERKQKLARWRRTHERFECAGKAFKTGETTVRAQPRAVAP